MDRTYTPRAADLARSASADVAAGNFGVTFAVKHVVDRQWLLLDVLKELAMHEGTIRLGGRPPGDLALVAARGDDRGVPAQLPGPGGPTGHVGSTAHTGHPGPARYNGWAASGLHLVGDHEAGPDPDVVADRPDPEEGGEWLETLSTTAYGSGAIMFVARETSPAGGAVRQVAELDGHGIFRGRARPNPAFLYGGSSYIELFVRLPMRRKRAGVGDCRILRSLVEEIARNAAGPSMRAPILFLQSPASRPPRRSRNDVDRDNTEEEPLRFAQDLGVRCAVAIPNADVAMRSEFVRPVLRFCAANGLGCWIGDRRLDRRSGQWFRLLAPDEAVYDERVAEETDEADGDLAVLLPMTFVGPARVGTTLDVVRALGVAGYPVASMAVTVLQSLAFIHVLVPLPSDAPVLEHCHQPFAAELKLGGGHLDRFFGPGADFGLASDYAALVGPSNDGIPSFFGDSRALWAAWDLPHVRGALETSLLRLQDALADIGVDGAVNVEYLISRRTPSGHLRGRCKIAAPKAIVDRFRTDDSGISKTRFARAVEHRWRRLLREDDRYADAEVEFAWREMWLGRWAPLNRGSR